MYTDQKKSAHSSAITYAAGLVSSRNVASRCVACVARPLSLTSDEMPGGAEPRVSSPVLLRRHAHARAVRPARAVHLRRDSIGFDPFSFHSVPFRPFNGQNCNTKIRRDGSCKKEAPVVRRRSLENDIGTSWCPNFSRGTFGNTTLPFSGTGLPTGI